MTQTSLSQSPNDTTSSQDVIEIKTVTRSVGRKATITKEELFQAALNLIGPQKSIASLSLREVAREAGIAPNSFYRHFKDIDELAISLIDRAGIVLRKIIRQARLRASLQDSIIRSSVEIFLQQLDADEGNLSLLLREGFTGSASYKAAVDRQLNFFQQELQEDLIRLERLNNNIYTTLNLLQKQLHNLFFTWVPK
ncbi:bacterial regulatory s, tetR family protein [Acinetobacter baumannii 24860_1]|nr:bacterial regulatory s, tetR family protein [Acinetobacter baumannii 24860_1]